MTLENVITELMRMYTNSTKDWEVRVFLDTPQYQGPKPTTEVSSIERGIDWDANKIILHTEIPVRI